MWDSNLRGGLQIMRKYALLAVVLVAVAMPAAAVDRGFYLGAGVGVPSYEVGDFNEDYEDLRFEEDSWGLKLFGGYRIFKYLGVEAGYTDYGSISKRETSITLVDQKLEVDIDAWDLSVVGMVPLGDKVLLYAKAGAASWNADVTLTLDDEREEDPRDGTDLTFGMGLDFFFKRLGIRVALDWLNMEDTDGAFMFSGCLTYNF